MSPRTEPKSTFGAIGYETAHGAHVRCQAGSAYVTALCGAILDWDDEVPPTADACVVCRDFTRCPLCGAPVTFLA